MITEGCLCCLMLVVAKAPRASWPLEHLGAGMCLRVSTNSLPLTFARSRNAARPSQILECESYHKTSIFCIAKSRKHTSRWRPEGWAGEDRKRGCIFPFLQPRQTSLINHSTLQGCAWQICFGLNCSGHIIGNCFVIS